MVGMPVKSQQSTSSLARHAVARSPGVDIFNGSPSRDFCNSFWGADDAGVHILFARLRGAARTTDDLRQFWKERAQIEEEYATKLNNLAKRKIGVEEIGELRNGIDTLRLETKKIANAHQGLAGQIREEMEVHAEVQLGKQMDHKRKTQASLEKMWRQKQAAESHVLKAREKCLSDRQRIEAYRQQLREVSGAGGIAGGSGSSGVRAEQQEFIDRTRKALTRSEQTAQANEQDLLEFSRALKEMMPSWETSWREFCDSCQDLEEDRVEFTKDNLWAYANAVSTVCVADDNSCETIRTVLDHLEADKELEGFVNEYGTGNTVSDVSVRVDGVPSSPVKQRVAQYPRRSRRPAPALDQSTSRPPDHEKSYNDLPAATNSTTTVSSIQPPIPPAKQPPQTARPIAPTVITSLERPPHSRTNATTNPVNTPSTPGSRYGSESTRDTGPTPWAPSPIGTSSSEHGNGAIFQRSASYAAPGNPKHSASTSTDHPNTNGAGAGPSLFSKTDARYGRRGSQPLPQPFSDQLRVPAPPMDPPPMVTTNGSDGDSSGGDKILFYVQALYDYRASIDEEFDFQKDDIIAVTATPPDGWWSGELLDEARREEGRHIFPSNFVTLF